MPRSSEGEDVEQRTDDQLHNFETFQRETPVANEVSTQTPPSTTWDEESWLSPSIDFELSFLNERILMRTTAMRETAMRVTAMKVTASNTPKGRNEPAECRTFGNDEYGQR